MECRKETDRQIFRKALIKSARAGSERFCFQTMVPESPLMGITEFCCKAVSIIV